MVFAVRVDDGILDSSIINYLQCCSTAKTDERLDPVEAATSQATQSRSSVVINIDVRQITA